MRKNEALQVWLQPFLDDNFIKFQSIDNYPDARAVIPTNAETVYEDITGVKVKEYVFSFIGIVKLDTGTSYKNAKDLDIFDTFNDWIEEQNANANFPQFPNCTNFELEALQDTATLAYIDDDNNAKYVLSVKIKYEEQ